MTLDGSKPVGISPWLPIQMVRPSLATTPGVGTSGVGTPGFGTSGVGTFGVGDDSVVIRSFRRCDEDPRGQQIDRSPMDASNSPPLQAKYAENFRFDAKARQAQTSRPPASFVRG